MKKMKNTNGFLHFSRSGLALHRTSLRIYSIQASQTQIWPGTQPLGCRIQARSAHCATPSAHWPEVLHAQTSQTQIWPGTPKEFLKDLQYPGLPDSRLPYPGQVSPLCYSWCPLA